MRKVGVFVMIFGWRLMVVVMIYVDGGCQELPNEPKNTKTDLGGGSYGQNGVGSGLI